MFKILVHSFLILFSTFLCAQENVKPLTANINYLYKDIKHSSARENNFNQFSANQNKNRSISTVTLSLPFIDDFSYSTTQSLPNQSLWVDSSVYVNSGFGIAPLSIGVATFDGLNKFGYPYTPNLTNLSASLPADFLTSMPIDLSASAVPNGVADSVALSFYYQAKGNGEAPEITDSLLLDFYHADSSVWINVWFQRGNTSPNTNDTMFKRAFIMLDTSIYFRPGFKFRFRNKATTCGDFDHWNLDYVYLNANRINGSIGDTAYNDFSIGYVPSPLLKNYASMPWRQYDTSELAHRLTVFVRNNGTAPNIGYGNTLYDVKNTFTQIGPSYSGGQALSNYFNQVGWLNHASISNPPNTYSFAPMTDFTDFMVKHYLIATNTVSSSGDFIPANDTVIQHQDFNNYYAYDDGSCEGAYYINNYGAKIAVKYSTRVADTLRAFRLFLDPADDSFVLSQEYTFRLNVWTVGAGGAPGNIFYADTIDKAQNFSPTGCYNCLSEYQLSNSIILPPGTYFFGIQQKIASGIKIGFDKNLDHSSNLYYDYGNGWTQSQIYGSLMLRPVFGTNPTTVGIKENTLSKNNLFSVYPNPASDQFTIQSNEIEKGSYILINALGQTINEALIEGQQQIINTEHLSNGIYFLSLKINGQSVQQHKIIIQH